MKRILVFRTGQLGDALCSLPALNVLRAKWGLAERVLLFDRHVGRSYVLSKAVLSGGRLIDRFIGYPVGYSFVERVRALMAAVRLIDQIRRERFDCVIHLEPELKTRPRLLRDKIFFRLAGIRKQITTLQYRRPRSNVRPLEPLEHETDFFLRALGAQGFKVPPPGQGDMDLGLGEKETEEVREWLREAGSGKPEAGNLRPEGESDSSTLSPQVSCLRSQSAIGVGVGSKMQSKRWPLERFRVVLQRLIESHDMLPVFIGGPEDAEAADHLVKDLGRGLNACGRLSLRGSARALQDCQFYLGNDTGTMHLAVAAGIQCVAIFSARDVPGKWYPYGKGHKVHRVPVDCEGCMLYECHEQGRKCLMAIGVEEVYASCLQVLNEQVDAEGKGVLRPEN